MKTQTITTTLLTVAIIAITTGAAQAKIIVRPKVVVKPKIVVVKPAPVKTVVIKPVKPVKTKIWVPGHYVKKSKHRRVWVPGHWKRI